MPFYTLGLETSCDETAAAVLRDEGDLLSNVIYSQADLHETFGGVVPEVASRDHVKKVTFVLRRALDEAGVSFRDLDLIAATRGPGLIGCLLVGLSLGEGLAYGLGVPFVGVNHLEGHLFAHYLEHPEAEPPLVALIASGGHTSLVYVKAWGAYKVLGSTRDDAAGEAFDKVGKLMGLGYPAGPRIDRLARQGNKEAVPLPRPLLEGFEFSFAGLKTAVLYHLKEHPDTDRADLAASFQAAAVDVLAEKLLRAAEAYKVERMAVVGGVAANSGLRARLEAEGRKRGRRVYFPSPALCTDNAAMIAACARYRYARLEERTPDVRADPALALP